MIRPWSSERERDARSRGCRSGERCRDPTGRRLRAVARRRSPGTRGDPRARLGDDPPRRPAGCVGGDVPSAPRRGVRGGAVRGAGSKRGGGRGATHGRNDPRCGRAGSAGDGRRRRDDHRLHARDGARGSGERRARVPLPHGGLRALADPRASTTTRSPSGSPGSATSSAPRSTRPCRRSAASTAGR